MIIIMTSNPADWHSYLAPYASRLASQRGRLYPEDEDPYRTAWQRDQNRILHSSAFRRLERKTQVFVATEDDHHRTRLTHTLEVAQIARSMARCLHAHEDLAEAIAFAHDLGHPPFGHSGERALAKAMQDYGGFNHNDQTLRIVTELESRYHDFQGLNLTWETLEGIVKHNGPVKKPYPFHLANYHNKHDLELDTQPSLEAQIANIADDIAYNNHDIDDGLRRELFTLQELRNNVPAIDKLYTTMKPRKRNLDTRQKRHLLVRDGVNLMVRDVVQTTQKTLATIQTQSADALRQHSEYVVMFSSSMRETIDQLRCFLRQSMYHHRHVEETMQQGQKIIDYLFHYCQKNPQSLPELWRHRWQNAAALSQTHAARVLCDYIAGMTDRFAKKTYEDIRDESRR